MSDRCDRCKRGYGNTPPKDDVEWLLSPTSPPAAGTRTLRIGRCTRCDSWLVDLWSTDRERAGVEQHDLCVILHDSARSALLDRSPSALAALSAQLRRRHLEELCAGMPTNDRTALEKIERGELECTELFRGLATRAFAVASALPPIGDVRPKNLFPKRTAGVSLRVPLDLGDGSRAVLEPVREGGGLILARMRGDAVVWRAEIPAKARDGFLAPSIPPRGAAGHSLVVLTPPGPGEAHGLLFLVDRATGELRGQGPHAVRAASFDVQELPQECLFIAGYQSCAVLRKDGSVAWQSSATPTPGAVPIENGVVVVDAPWRLRSLELPSGQERWSMPIDRSTTIQPSEAGHLLLQTTDAVSRLDVRGEQPRLVWLASGGSMLPLVGGGAAVVRDRWEKSGRKIECVVLDARGRRRFSVSRPETTKVPIAELGPNVLLYHSGGDVAVSVRETISYVLSLPEARQAFLTLEEGGAWIEYDGVVDRIDHTGHRVGRWRVG